MLQNCSCHPPTTTAYKFKIIPSLIIWKWSLLLERHHSPHEYQSQSSVSTRSTVVHITGCVEERERNSELLLK